MKDLQDLALLIFWILVIIECIIYLYYLVIFIKGCVNKKTYIEKARQADDRILIKANNKQSTQAFEPLIPILEFWEDHSLTEFSCKVGENLNGRIKKSKSILNAKGIKRRLRFFDVSVNQTKKGNTYRRYEQNGKEWRSCEIEATVVEEYYSLDGNDLLSTMYYYSVKIYYSMSRRLHEADKKESAKRDMWGRKVKENEEFYNSSEIRICPSCGSKLPKDQKDIVCPYCHSTIFSDYFDWQMETFEIEPYRLKCFGLFGLIIYAYTHHAEEARLKNRNKKNKIVRFSENDFRKDVYDACIEHIDKELLVDLLLGKIVVRSIKNTDEDTILSIKVPVHRVLIDKDVKVKKETKKMKAKFIRSRYPNRVNKKDLAVFQEKACPTCGGPFIPDEKGCCKNCGTFLFVNNLKWKMLTSTETNA